MPTPATSPPRLSRVRFARGRFAGPSSSDSLPATLLLAIDTFAASDPELSAAFPSTDFSSLSNPPYPYKPDQFSIGMADAGVTLPYCVVRHTGKPKQVSATTGRDRVTQIVVMFSVYAGGPTAFETSEQLALLVERKYRRNRLQFSNGYVLSAEPMGCPVGLPPAKAAGNQVAVEHQMRMTYLIGRQLSR